MKLLATTPNFKPHNPYLLYSSTFMFFREFPEMEAFVELTFEYEIWRIGTLIQLNERDAYRILRATTSQKQIVAQEFKVSGLCFGVKIGGWAVPEDLNRQGLMH